MGINYFVLRFQIKDEINYYSIFFILKLMITQIKVLFVTYVFNSYGKKKFHSLRNNIRVEEEK
jgi:hypothetical protein